MKCDICGATAMRQGTKGRAYCFAHDSYAFDQAKGQSLSKSAEHDAISQEVQIRWSQERMARAV